MQIKKKIDIEENKHKCHFRNDNIFLVLVGFFFVVVVILGQTIGISNRQLFSIRLDRPI
jgi:hypothetical protein